MKSIVAARRAQGIEPLTLAIGSDPATVVQYASEYASQSRTDSKLVGIGIDDFLSALVRWSAAAGGKPDAPANLLREVLAGVDTRNPHLSFGITLYEDQLQSALLRSPAMPDDLRARINRVSLFLHYRENGPRYAAYVTAAQQLFPNAAIVGGVYAYDRIDYLVCSQGSTRRCSPQEEEQLFVQALRIQADLLNKGALRALEFSPGNFGTEKEWPSWSDARTCQPSRREQCVNATIEMHKMTLQTLQQSGILVSSGAAE